MGHGVGLKGRAAEALRAAGYKPCPRWWLTQEQMDLLEYMAKQNEQDVNRIRVAALGLEPLTEAERKARDMERAWQAHARGGRD